MTFRFFALLVVGLMASSPAAHAAVIYDNIGATFPGLYGFSNDAGYAFQFTAGSTAYASSVDAPIVASGTSAVSVTMGLYADSGSNSVGTLLETFQLTSDVSPVNLVSASMSGLTLLTSGNKYWLRATSTSRVDWYTGNTQGIYRYFNGETYDPNVSSVMAAFRINGESTAPVPLPAAAWLLLSGLGVLGFLRKRKAA